MTVQTLQPDGAASAFATSGASPRPDGCIDCQCHLFVPEILDRMNRRRRDPVVYRRGEYRYIRMGSWYRCVRPHFSDPGALVTRMDEAGIGLTVLSVNDPGPEWFGREAPAVARAANDFVTEIVQRWPGRFLGLCVLPLLHEKAARAELERCIGRLGMRGILLYTNVAGRFPDEPRFRWLFARAEESGLPVLLHPARPVTMDAVSAYDMTSSLGNMFEDTIALTRLIMAGILDEFPGLKLVCPHLGGALPYLIGRIDHQVRVLRRGPATLAHPPGEYIRRVWFDIVSPMPEALRFALELVGPDRLLFASDYPWVDPQVILDVINVVKPTGEVRARILRGNAERLFSLTPSTVSPCASAP